MNKEREEKKFILVYNPRDLQSAYRWTLSYIFTNILSYTHKHIDKTRLFQDVSGVLITRLFNDVSGVNNDPITFNQLRESWSRLLGGVVV